MRYLIRRLQRLAIVLVAVKFLLVNVLTILGLQVARLMGGAIIIEQIFGIPGVGRLLIHAVYTRDFIVIQGCVTFFALAFVAANFLVDVAYAWLDPRVRQGRAHG